MIGSRFAPEHRGGAAHNHVSGTSLRGIDMGEMSMGTIEHNTIAGAQLPIQEQYFAHATLHKNTIQE